MAIHGNAKKKTATGKRKSLFSEATQNYTYLACYIAFAALAVFAIAFSHIANWDVDLIHFFYQTTEHKWLGNGNLFFLSIYQYFPFFALLAFLLCVSSILYCRLFWPNKSSKITVFCTLALITNAVSVEILKKLIDRTRPYDLQSFHALYDYLPISFQRYALDGISFSSFPSGHAIAGFGLTIFAYPYIHHNKKKAITLFVIATTMGVLLSVTRMAQGGHFFSDLLFSFALSQIINLSFGQKIMLTAKHSKQISTKKPAQLLDIFFPLIQPAKEKKTDHRKKPYFWLGICALWSAILFFYFNNFFLSIVKEQPYQCDTQLIIQKMHTNPDFELKIRYLPTEQIMVRHQANADGFAWEKITPTTQWQKSETSCSLSVGFQTDFFTHSFNGLVRVDIPETLKPKVTIIPSKAYE